METTRTTTIELYSTDEAGEFDIVRTFQVTLYARGAEADIWEHEHTLTADEQEELELAADEIAREFSEEVA